MLSVAVREVSEDIICNVSDKAASKGLGEPEPAGTPNNDIYENTKNNTKPLIKLLLKN